jgi:uncharacterized protein YukE
MSMMGMNVEQVRQLAGQLEQGAQQLEEIVSRLTNARQSAEWVGPDREQFMGEWTGQHVQQLRTVANGIREAGQKANRNAEEQQSTSSTL